MVYLEVAVATPIHTTLTYREAPASGSDPRPGLRVRVPLGSRQVTGYVLSCFEALPESTNYTVRPVTAYLDQVPLFPGEMVPFFRWLANYYQYPIGEIIKSALPAGLAPQSGRHVELTAAGRARLEALPPPERPGLWFEALLRDGRLSSAMTARIWRGKDRKLLELWESQGDVVIRTVFGKDKVKAKTELCVRRSRHGLGEARLQRSEQRVLEAIADIAGATNRPWVPGRELGLRYPSYRKVLPRLEGAGLILREERAVYRDPFGDQPPSSPEPDRLTGDQQAALAVLRPAIDRHRFAPFLLHGVTGSGKTEVYLRAANHTIEQGRQVLVLVPEIALATQLEGNFLSRFGDQVAILHSGLSEGERYDQWNRIAHGQASIVIGARSALFAPVANPGLIVVDEEHDGAYKQEDGFRYNARDAAVMRASQTRAVVLLGSATPSIISYSHAISGKYQLLTLPRRVADRTLPAVEVIDLRTVPTVSGKPPIFSPQFIDAIKENHAAGDQTLVFLNRRGFANLVLCRGCGQTLQCGHCHVSLTLHQQRGQLLCHYCGFARSMSALCPNCQSTELIMVGFGTERIEDELKRLLPTARIGRLDRDTASSRTRYLAILKAMHQREIDILVGTQMITKGHHFPHVTLVGVVWADAGLGLPDFKAGERTFQLLTQVFGRAGRGEKPGRVMVQTYNPEHYSIVNSKGHDFETLYRDEMQLRRELSFPPFSRLVNIRIEGPDKSDVERAAKNLGRIARREAKERSVSVLGPAPAPIGKLKDTFRWQMLLKSADLTALHGLSSYLVSLKPAAIGAGAVKLLVDVDPESMI